MILYQQHVMWYEEGILWESINSLTKAMLNCNEPIKVMFCFNSQTYLEQPIEWNEEWYRSFLLQLDSYISMMGKEHTFEFIIKTDKDPFYNIGDWRREIYDPSAKYTVWGETDCLIPYDYFYILSQLPIEHRHILSLSSRIMWDSSWKPVMHEAFQDPELPYVDNQKPRYNELIPYRYFDLITQKELDKFNDDYEIKIIKLLIHKVDGSLLALSGGLPTPFIAPDMNFVREDTCAEQFFKIKGIPQYHISTRLKGHNYYHPEKRTNTTNSRDEKTWKEMEAKQTQAMIKFLNGLI